MSWVKIIHILCVMGWMTSIFAVPRAIIYWKREHEKLGENGPLGDLTYRLYRFSFGLGIIAIITGTWYGLWLGWPTWLHLKVTLVVLLAAHYLWTGRLVKRAQRGVFTESDMYLRIFNEVSVIGTIAILWVVVAQPF
ncbi:CopD family protein [Tropicibacter oceani]|uniref:Protoporphyrinogen IX oxidase n=1 Tax=Tropicibacter oceani TaxID=3058420 RepID=A0ABY8QJ05_9RHOB|nr:CopD family protein [Tropicibacter oceani]WGW04423.1 CopD family protein [Tropicibacter oceani]